MLLLDLIKDFDLCASNSEVFVEINGVVHSIHGVNETSQGIMLIVDTDKEDEEMR